MKIRSLIAMLSLVMGLLPAVAASTAASAQPLVDTTWLRQHLNDKNLVVLDVYVEDKRVEFAAGHIPGALFTDFIRGGWRAKVGGAGGMLPEIKDIEKVIGSYGIDNQSHVVLVPAGREKSDFNAAARIYWTFKVLGHDKVSILDGGDKAWFADKANPVETGAPTAKPKQFVAHYRPEYRASRDDVKRAIATHDAQLVDARPPEQYLGKAKSPSVRVAGTLPGAVNVPTGALQAPDSTRVANATTIDKVMSQAGAKLDANQIAFCNTAHLASGTWFVLHEIKGNKRARLYDGSMSDWTSDVTLPVVNQPSN
jgi:thiosulfate/3-mercaptopyruvate sulfurtransferase